MRGLRVLEIAFALIASGLTASGIAYLLTSPFYCGQRSSNGVTGPKVCYRLMDMSDPVIAGHNRMILAYVALLIVAFLLGIASAVLYGRTRGRAWRLALWSAAIFTVIFSILSAASLALVVMPAALALLVAALVSLGIPASAPSSA